ncbi:MAG: hypothetical protein HYY13_11085 [Nitrospirae bacterium]|nr:hypothetical protein [Nitrospirota bacterium]
MFHLTATEADLVSDGLIEVGTVLTQMQPWAPLIAGAGAATLLVRLALSFGTAGWSRALSHLLVGLLALALVAPQPGTESKDRASLLISGAVKFTNSVSHGIIKLVDDAAVTGFYDSAQVLPFRRSADLDTSARLDFDTEESLDTFLRYECFPTTVKTAIRNGDWGQAAIALAAAHAPVGTEMKTCLSLYLAAQADLDAWKGTQSNNAVFFAGRRALYEVASQRASDGVTTAAASVQAAPPETGLCEWCLRVADAEFWGTVMGWLVKVWIYAVPLHFMLVFLPGGVTNVLYSLAALWLFQLAVFPLYVLHLVDRYAAAHPPAAFSDSDLLHIIQESVFRTGTHLGPYLGMHNRYLYVEAGITIVLGGALAALLVWKVLLPVGAKVREALGW